MVIQLINSSLKFRVKKVSNIPDDTPADYIDNNTGDVNDSHDDNNDKHDDVNNGDDNNDNDDIDDQDDNNNDNDDGQTCIQELCIQEKPNILLLFVLNMHGPNVLFVVDSL